jgi:hypothetical protein
VRDLSLEEQQVLQELYHRTSDATIKTRCQIILLSASSMSLPQIAQVTFYSEDTVARRIKEKEKAASNRSKEAIDRD